ncbi:GDP-L-fucose synthase [Cichlidogyrus casuarinus]|uniref:GDP-L-fucose synthase n=1 Tax=Cichlidogyrus casuarinus TaxID=1844966 RepID=A0ABD2PUV8_9PLAT
MTTQDDYRPVVLVTGGTGLVGNGVRLALESEAGSKYRDFKFVYFGMHDCDLIDKQNTKQFFKKFSPKYVIHLAARVGGLFANMKDNHGFLMDNLNMNINVLEAAFECGVKRLVCCLTTCIFPDSIDYPISEDKLHLGPPHESNYGYSYAKRMLEVMCRSYNEKFGTEFVTFAPTNVFGPFDNYNLKSAHVLPALIHKAYLAKKQNEALEVAGSGKPLRQFIYSVDLGKLVLWMLLEYKGTNTIIFSVPESEEMSIAQVAQIVSEAMGLEAGIKITNKGADGQYKKTVSTNKLHSLYPDFKFTPFKEAVQQSCEWLSENYSMARI